MGHSEFETKVLEGLAVLRSDMKRLVGEDGNAGVIADLDGRIDALEKRPGRLLGAVASTGIGAAVAIGVQKIFGHH